MLGKADAEPQHLMRLMAENIVLEEDACAELLVTRGPFVAHASIESLRMTEAQVGLRK